MAKSSGNKSGSFDIPNKNKQKQTNHISYMTSVHVHSLSQRQKFTSHYI